MVKGNHALLSAMLLNLAKNSANYSHGTYCRLEMYRPTADELATVSKTNDTHSITTDSNASSDPDNFYYFRFYDDGIGVPPEHLPRLFQRFYRIESGRGRKSGGTGLGLAIVYNTTHTTMNIFRTAFRLTLPMYLCFLSNEFLLAVNCQYACNQILFDTEDSYITIIYHVISLSPFSFWTIQIE